MHKFLPFARLFKCHSNAGLNSPSHLLIAHVRRTSYVVDQFTVRLKIYKSTNTAHHQYSVLKQLVFGNFIG